METAYGKVIDKADEINEEFVSHVETEFTKMCKLLSEEVRTNEELNEAMRICDMAIKILDSGVLDKCKAEPIIVAITTLSDYYEYLKKQSATLKSTFIDIEYDLKDKVEAIKEEIEVIKDEAKAGDQAAIDLMTALKEAMNTFSYEKEMENIHRHYPNKIRSLVAATIKKVYSYNEKGVIQLKKFIDERDPYIFEGLRGLKIWMDGFSCTDYKKGSLAVSSGNPVSTGSVWRGAKFGTPEYNKKLEWAEKIIKKGSPTQDQLMPGEQTKSDGEINKEIDDWTLADKFLRDHNKNVISTGAPNSNKQATSGSNNPVKSAQTNTGKSTTYNKGSLKGVIGKQLGGGSGNSNTTTNTTGATGYTKGSLDKLANPKENILDILKRNQKS